jgi:hypothetical protein
MSWDKRLNFDEWDHKFRKDLRDLTKEKGYYELKKRPVPITVLRRFLYISILITQLENGSRISEAVEAVLNLKLTMKEYRRYGHGNGKRTTRAKMLMY